MAGNISNYLELKILEHVTGKTAYSAPGGVYAALFTVSPAEAGGGTEVVAAGYARVLTSWASAAGGSISTAADLRFPVVGGAPANWGTIVALGLFDASTSGNLLWYGPTSANIAVNTGDDFKIAAGSLTLSLD